MQGQRGPISVESKEEVRRGSWSKPLSELHFGENKLGNKPTQINQHLWHSTDGQGQPENQTIGVDALAG